MKHPQTIAKSSTHALLIAGVVAVNLAAGSMLVAELLTDTTAGTSGTTSSASTGTNTSGTTTTEDPATTTKTSDPIVENTVTTSSPATTAISSPTVTTTEKTVASSSPSSGTTSSPAVTTTQKQETSSPATQILQQKFSEPIHYAPPTQPITTPRETTNNTFATNEEYSQWEEWVREQETMDSSWNWDGEEWEWSDDAEEWWKADDWEQNGDDWKWVGTEAEKQFLPDDVQDFLLEEDLDWKAKPSEPEEEILVVEPPVDDALPEAFEEVYKWYYEDTEEHTVLSEEQYMEINKDFTVLEQEILLPTKEKGSLQKFEDMLEKSLEGLSSETISLEEKRQLATNLRTELEKVDAELSPLLEDIRASRPNTVRSSLSKMILQFPNVLEILTKHNVDTTTIAAQMKKIETIFTQADAGCDTDVESCKDLSTVLDRMTALQAAIEQASRDAHVWQNVQLALENL